MTREINERLALLERALEDLPKIRDDISALKRFQVAVTATIAALGALAAFFADGIRKKFGL